MKYKVSFSIYIEAEYILNEDRTDYYMHYYINHLAISKDHYDHLMKTFDGLFTKTRKRNVLGGHSVTYCIHVGDIGECVDITDPIVQKIMSLLYDNGIYPTYHHEGGHYYLYREIEYEESDLESCKYLQLNVVTPMNKRFNERRAKDGSLIVPGKLANGKNPFISPMDGSIVIAAQKVVDILHNAKLTRHLILQDVGYTTDKYKERMYRLASDINLPCPYNKNYRSSAPESEEEREKRRKYGVVWPRPEDIYQPWYIYLESQISSLEPFDFAFFHPYEGRNDSHNCLFVSQDVYQLFKREGWLDLDCVGCCPVRIFPDDNLPPLGGFDFDFAKLLAPFLPPDVRCLYGI